VSFNFVPISVLLLQVLKSLVCCSGFTKDLSRCVHSSFLSFSSASPGLSSSLKTASFRRALDLSDLFVGSERRDCLMTTAAVDLHGSALLVACISTNIDPERLGGDLVKLVGYTGPTKPRIVF